MRWIAPWGRDEVSGLNSRILSLRMISMGFINGCWSYPCGSWGGESSVKYEVGEDLATRMVSSLRTIPCEEKFMMNECHDDSAIEHSGGPIINHYKSYTWTKYLFTVVKAGLRQLAWKTRVRISANAVKSSLVMESTWSCWNQCLVLYSRRLWSYSLLYEYYLCCFLSGPDRYLNVTRRFIDLHRTIINLYWNVKKKILLLH